MKVYAAQPREGTETRVRLSRPRTPSDCGLCSSTPRGDGNVKLRKASTSLNLVRFMQLNPARGRKLEEGGGEVDHVLVMVYAAQPREGTETCSVLQGPSNILTVYAAQPREGTETSAHGIRRVDRRDRVYAAQPREGDGNRAA